jgi:outer membrane protein TolC
LLAIGFQEALELAEINSTAVQLSTIRTKQAELMTSRALASLSPRLVAQSAYKRNQQEISFDLSENFGFLESVPGWDVPDSITEPTVIQPLVARSASLTVSQTLLNAQLPSIWSSAKSQVEAARQSEADTRSRIQQQTLTLYSQGYLLAEANAVAQESLDLAALRLERIEAEVRSGQARPQQLLQAKLDLQRSRRELIEAEQGHKKAMRDLESLICQSPGDLLPLPSPPPLTSLGELQSKALANRSDLLKSRAERDAVAALHRSKYYEWVPLLEGSYSYSYSDNIAFSDLNTQWRFDLKAQWTLWDGGFRLLDQREQHLQLQGQKLVVQEKESQIERDLSELWEQSEQEAAQVDELELQVALARHNLEAAELARNAGDMGEAALLEARWLLSQALWLEMQADEAHKRSLFLLHSYVGGDLSAHLSKER